MANRNSIQEGAEPASGVAPTHCQVCGRAIKAPDGYPMADRHLSEVMDRRTIAHHGYQRPGQGWQTQSCAGARWRPYEVACDALPPVIGGLVAWIGSRQVSLDKLLAEPPASFECTRTDAWGKVTAKWTAVRKSDFTIDAAADYNSQSYVTEFRKRRLGLQRDIEGASADLATLRQRLADWKAPAEAAP